MLCRNTPCGTTLNEEKTCSKVNKINHFLLYVKFKKNGIYTKFFFQYVCGSSAW